MNNIIGDYIKTLSKEKGLTQKELAKAAGINEATLSRYISGTRKPNAESLSNIANALGTSSEVILGKAKVQTLLEKIGPIPISKASSFITPQSKAFISQVEGKTIISSKDQKNSEEENQFNAMIRGILFTNLSLLKFRYSCISDEKDNASSSFLKINLFDTTLDEWWFYFWHQKDTKDLKTIFSVDSIISFIISKFVMKKPNKKRKITIVITDNELFKEFQKYINNISFKGYMSILLINTKSTEIIDEILLSKYDDSNHIDLPSLKKKKKENNYETQH